MLACVVTLQVSSGVAMAQKSDLEGYLESILGIAPVQEVEKVAPHVDTAVIVRNRIRLSEPYYGEDGLRQLDADIARSLAPRVTFRFAGSGREAIHNHVTMAKSLRSFNDNWPERRYEVLAVARNGNTIEIQVRFERVDKTGVSSAGYALFRVEVDNQGKITMMEESSSPYSPPGFSSGMQPVAYHGEEKAPAVSSPTLRSSEDRSSLDPLIARMRALKCKYAVSAEQQRHLLELLPLIRQGESVNLVLPNTNGCTALHYSCGIGSLSITKWLLQHGANPNARDNNGVVPLRCVGDDNRAAIINALLEYGAQW